MKEIYGNVWELIEIKDFEILCITTNGTIKKNGDAVMGRGIALEAKNRFPYIESKLGSQLQKYGNHIHLLEVIKREDASVTTLCSFPVKHNWQEKADIELIKKSCLELIELIDDAPFHINVLLPRPGCGNGGLNWEDVKREIEPLLDDRFYIVHFKED